MTDLNNRYSVTGTQTELSETNGRTADVEEYEFVTKAEVIEIVTDIIKGLRVYVLESDITDAQNAIKATVTNSEF